MTTAAAAGKPSPIHPPDFRITHSILKRQRRRLLRSSEPPPTDLDRTPVQEPSRSEAPTRSPDPKSSHPTSPPPTPEQVTASWKRAWRTLFHCGHTASTLQASPGHQTLHLEGPNLHSRAKIHSFPSPPRPTRPSEARMNGGLAGWSTSFESMWLAAAEVIAALLGIRTTQHRAD
ncbi:unnamed protein product [Miscanthus lutarioriparius]|uniref:Uncharacterized protein n=1 Tax=Miscanthus lutarioriparius TaxID=422564 RepID=A0A811QRN5_9POAL|nr:unnamed protein product [Miscanthus lutarioriparius]